jgi:hypothetical protein
VVVEAAATIKGSTAGSASLCFLIGAASWDTPDLLDLPEPGLGNGNWEQTLFSVYCRIISGLDRCSGNE